MHSNLHKDWSHLKPCDSHTHLYQGKSFEWNVQFLRGYMEWFDVERVAILALPEHSGENGRDEASNLRCLGAKAALNAENNGRYAYALAGLVQDAGPEPDTAETFVRQARSAFAMGFDGYKSLLGKPGIRKWVGVALDDPIFDPFYSLLEEEGKPFVMHVGDPENFWDVANAPQWLKETGWLCDETYPTLAQLRREAEGILKKHPALHATFAHTFFLGENPDEAERLFETYPNLGFDLAPGWEMHIGFTKFHDRWHGIFERYRDRIFFATDSSNWHSSEDISTYEYNFHWPYDLSRCLVEDSGPFPWEIDDGSTYTFLPVDASPETREAVLRGNFIRRFGEKPTAVNRAAALEAARRLLARYEPEPPRFTDAQAAKVSIGILRRWTRSEETLFT